jgi:hypothetical protein
VFKMKKLNLFMACMVCVFVLMSCQKSEFIKNTYNTLNSAFIAYDVSMKIASEAYAREEITEEQKDKIVAYGNVFYDSWQLANKSVQVYINSGQSEETKEQVKLAIKDMILKFDDFKGLIIQLVEDVNDIPVIEKIKEVEDGQ